MTWTWRYEAAAGGDTSGAPAAPSFGSRSDAESWVGETWRELLDHGVTHVALVEDEGGARREHYTMGLEPA